MSKEDNDNYNDEEYHFAVEPDSVESSDEKIESTEATEEPSKAKFDVKSLLDINKAKEYLQENVLVRNSLIALVAVIFLVIIYNLTSGMISKKKTKNTKSTVTTNQVKQTQVAQPVQQPSNFSGESQSKLESQNKSLQSKLRQVQQTQDTINSRVSSLSSDSFKLNTEYQEINEKLTKLADQVEKLASAVEDQAHTIMVMGERQHRQPLPSHVDHPIKRKTYMKYDVQAVIPGRAWLIGQNGSTLTVRKGSIIPGYGVVTLVDVAQGRVLTTSGQIIKFAQNDS